MTAGTYVTSANLKVRLGIGTADTTDDTLLGNICNQVNSYVEFIARRNFDAVAGTAAGGTATFDASEDVYDGQLYVHDGIRAVTSLSVAPGTGDAAVTATVADLIILPRSQARRPGWPGFWVVFKPVVTGLVSDWGVGYANIVMGYDRNFASYPLEIVEVAEVAAARAWSGRQGGQEDISGTDESGAPLIRRYFSAEDKKTLREFRSDLGAR
jgi:hypothetical protein